MKTDYAMVVRVLLQPSWNQKIKLYNPVRGNFYIEIEKAGAIGINEQKKLMATCDQGDIVEYTAEQPNIIIKNLSYERRITDFNQIYEQLIKTR